MPQKTEKPKRIAYPQLDEEARNEVNRRMVELKTADPPYTLQRIISTVRDEMNVIIKQHHIYQALKKSSQVEIKPLHAAEEIQPIEEEPKPFSIEELRESMGFARKIQFTIKDKSLLFYLVRLSESKKYGTKTTEKITERMQLCVIGTYSLQDNLIFPPSRSVEGKGRLTKKEQEQGFTEKIFEKKLPAGIKRGAIRVDTEGNYIPTHEAEEVDLKGAPLPIFPSSLHLKKAPNAIELKEVIDINDVLDHDIAMHYVLFPVETKGDTELKAIIYNLEESSPPKFLTFKFNYYASTNPYDAFLQLIEEKGMEYILMSVGTRHITEYIGLEEFPEEVLEIDEEFDLDFEL
jgi:hypothetical protein